MKILKIIAKFIFWFSLIIIAFYSTTIIIEKVFWKDEIPSFLGYKSFIVLSGSMKPTLNEGDIVITKENEDINLNDIISFDVGNSVVTHRIVGTQTENGQKRFVTKGDANSGKDDELVSIKDIEGKYVFKIPLLGNIILFFKSSNGIITFLIILVISLLIDNIKLDKKQN